MQLAVTDTEWASIIDVEQAACLVRIVCHLSARCYLLCAGASWSIFNTHSSWPRPVRAQLYGRNDMATGRPSFLYMAFTMLTYPIWLIQVCT